MLAPFKPQRPWMLFALLLGASFFGGLVTLYNFDSTRIDYALLSYRIPQYAVNYMDCGFVKRGFIGTLIGSLFPYSATAFILLAYTLLAVLIGSALYFYREFSPKTKESASTQILLVAAVLSPATFMHFGADLLRFDTINLALLLGSLVLIKRKLFITTGCLSAIALLIHEAYLLWGIPLLLAAFLLYHNHGSLKLDGKNTVRLGKILLPPAIAFVCILLLGECDAGFEHLSQKVQARCSSTLFPDSALAQKAYFPALEVWNTNSLKLPSARTLNTKELVQLPLLLVIVTIYGRFFIHYVRLPLLLLATVPILILFALGIDYYRWTSFMGTNAFILAIMGLHKKDSATKLSTRDLNVRLVMLLPLLGPLGVTVLSPLLIRMGKLFGLPF